MHQLSMPYESWPRLLSAIDDAVTYLGLKEVTYRLDVAKSTVCDALHDRNDRRWAQEWTCKVLEMLRERNHPTASQFAKAILDAQAAITGAFIVVENEVVTPEEIAAAERVLSIARKRRRSA